MSTLADLQQRNIARMESKETEAKNDGINEVSIIPSFDDTIIPSSDGMIDGIIKPSSTPSIKPSKKPSRTPSSGSAELKETNSKATNFKDALDAAIREHLTAQLLAGSEKGPVTRLNVEMPEDLHLRLKQHCVLTRKPIKALINALIAFYLDQEDAP
jgi:hypothetical protein